MGESASEQGEARRVAELFEQVGPVEELQIDDEFLAHMAERGTYQKHRVAVVELLEVHAGAPRYFLNSGTGRAPLLMVGRTGAGRWVCVPIEPTGQHGVWRAVTAFEANAHNRSRYAGGTT